jgi:ATP-dependent protease Clp ATPase subunit
MKTPEKKSRRSKTDRDLKCSFCGEPTAEVPLLITGPSVAICGECVSVCNDIVNEHMAKRKASVTADLAPELIRTPVPPPVKPCSREDRIKKLEVLTVALEERLSALEYNEGAPR